MKIALTAPVKRALAAASIATAGIVALAVLDAPAEDRGVPLDDPSTISICVDTPAEAPLPEQPPPRPATAAPVVVQPGTGFWS